MFVTRSHDRPAGLRPARRAFLARPERTGPRLRGGPLRGVIYGLFAAVLASCLAAAVAPGVASAAARAGHTIANARTLTIGKKTSGGGGPIDYWKVALTGGDQLQFLAKTPNPGCCGTGFYRFELYRPGTTDGNFPQRAPVMGTATSQGSTSSVLVLQAPYNGTFILAVCQNVSVNGDCRSVDSGGGSNPMAPYTFTDTLVKGGGRS